jgi:hypothetical protein
MDWANVSLLPRLSKGGRQGRDSLFSQFNDAELGGHYNLIVPVSSVNNFATARKCAISKRAREPLSFERFPKDNRKLIS